MDIRSPAVSNMSTSRFGGLGLMLLARRKRPSVVSPIAETTTTTSLPAARSAATRLATSRMRSVVASDVPPNFITVSDVFFLLATGPILALLIYSCYVKMRARWYASGNSIE